MHHRFAGQHKGKARKSQPAGSVRIIAGQWRGSRLPVPDLDGLRPSGDRSREILFNWLQAWLPGAHCLDLFAGTGVLGFEAASRGAEKVLLIDSQIVAVRAIETACERLGASNMTAIHSDALTWAGQCAGAYDIIFVDPPFADGLHEQVIELIMQNSLLKPGGWLYLETPSGIGLTIPEPLTIAREKQVGDVRLYLISNPNT